MAPLNKVCKKTSTKDGRNARQRRADRKRAARVPSEASLINLKSRIRHQSNRWLDYNLGAPDVRGGQNEIRWGFRSDVQLCERLDIERAEARRAAGVGPEAWVDDWWAQTVAGGGAGAGAGAGYLADSDTIIVTGAEDEKEGGENMEHDVLNEKGKKLEDKDEDEDDEDE